MKACPTQSGSLGDVTAAGLPRSRVYVVVAILAILMLTLAGRLAYLQVVQHDYYRRLASSEHWRQSVLPARRGEIVDRNGAPLASTVAYESLYGSTSEITNPSAVAARLAPIVDLPESTLRAQLGDRQ